MNAQEHVDLDKLELRIRRTLDDLNNIFIMLVRNVGMLSRENEELKKRLQLEDTGGPERRLTDTEDTTGRDRPARSYRDTSVDRVGEAGISRKEKAAKTDR